MTDVADNEPPETDTAPPAPPVRPDHVPEKFWDRDQGGIRTDALLKSYEELEHRLGAGVPEIPTSPEAYELTMPGGHIEPDTEVNARLHSAGFTQEQTQLVYDLAHEKLSPLIAEITNELQQGAMVAQLETRFGGKDKWQETSRQLKAWGQAHLPPDTFETLSLSVDGIAAMHRMMKSDEPGMVGTPAGTPGHHGERDLKQMMKDPRYWRDQDPAFVELVRKGFQALYPD